MICSLSVRFFSGSGVKETASLMTLQIHPLASSFPFFSLQHFQTACSRSRLRSSYRQDILGHEAINRCRSSPDRFPRMIVTKLLARDRSTLSSIVLIA
mmetsp:Transcript_47173/g.142846  ORF Transcript_47173/g.142846 Transcript_47173/m.142846 type:complete len:98 (-) Transcript_47173:11-304(-)